MPAGGVHPRGQAVGDRGVVHLVDQRGVDPLQFGFVELRRGTAEGRQVEGFEQRAPVGDRLDRKRRAQPREQRDDRLRLEPALAEGVAAQRTEPFRQFAFLADQQRLMREPGHLRRTIARGDKRAEHLDLHRGVADMVFAAQHVGHPHREIVDRAGKHVEPAAVGAADDRIGQLGWIELLRPADAVVPADGFAVVELEPPVRGDALGLLGRALRVAQFQRAAIVDRRQTPPEADLALQLEFLLRLVTGIDPPRLAQRVERRLVAGEPVRLPLLAIAREPQPAEIAADRVDEFLAAAFGVGIIDPQQEAAARLLGEHPVVERGADVADMKAPGGRRGEACDDGHARADSRGRRAWRAFSRSPRCAA